MNANLRLIPAIAALSAIPLAASAQVVVPAWAFPNVSPPFVAARAPFDSVTPLHVPSSSRSFTLAQIKDQFVAPDWAPTSHPRMPESVARGKRGKVPACGYCHLPDGQGRSENATLAGLPADYIVRQMADFRSRARRSALDKWPFTTRMHDIADSVSDADVVAAARYFSRLRVKPRYRVVEQSEVPATYQIGGVYSVKPDGGTEPLGQRLIDVTVDFERHELHDPTETFTTYAPPGSIERGRRIATASIAGKNAPTACVTCHGPNLRGVGQVPSLAGRSPAYMLRQLLGFKTGNRTTPASAPMQAVVDALTLDDMIAAAAYAGSRRP